MRRAPTLPDANEDKRTSRRRAGDEGELQALHYLEQAGLRLT